MTKNEFARMHGIPKAFRQYAKRYGSDIVRLAQEQRRPVPMLDHWRDKIVATHKALGL